MFLTLNEYTSGLFEVNTANDDIKEAQKIKVPKMLFDKFWFETEICYLFGDTGTGKSILAVLIADAISRSVPIRGFKMTARKQSVLYFDFELNKKQFEKRYSKNYKSHYVFDDGFKRVTLSPAAIFPGNKPFADYVKESMEEAIIKNKAKVIIIDNITYLNNTTSAKSVGRLMAEFKRLKEKYGLSILIVAHTPKRNANKPLTVDDIQGSKMMGNFMDSGIAIGKSVLGENIRYIKQVKERNTEKVYGANNVCVCKVIQPDNFLQFELTGFSSEQEHLESRNTATNNNDEMIEQINQLRTEGHSLREIGAKVGFNAMRVKRILDK